MQLCLTAHFSSHLHIKYMGYHLSIPAVDDDELFLDAPLSVVCEDLFPSKSVPSPSPSNSSIPPSSASFCRSRYFLRAFFILLAFFFLAASAFSATRLWSPFSWASTLSAKSERAIFSFCERDRVAWHLTTIPEGAWMICTAELVLFYAPVRLGF